MSSVLAQAPTVAPPAFSRAATDHTGAPGRGGVVRGGRQPGAFPARNQGTLRVATPSYRPDAPYPAVPFEADGAGVLRVIADPRTPVFVTVQTSGRRRYGYWQPYDSRTKRGGCYVALPTAVCDQLHEAGRIALDGPLVDPGKTTYRVRPAGTPAPPTRLPAAPVRTPRAPARAVPRPLAA
ncbi:cell envelope biogenesis protein OmpA [Streptomyces griseoviridis]|uniref:Cell envelope biogenesis protein OmpA n=3 Tax=Streptomyces TaxID=1883 RepID=A0ABT9LRJ6_STRGD|nr:MULTISPECIES: cell envelope biogenesis protein OmpA [Streptomyces]MDP9686164.1 hypothetical protein [Streptomyces griseoviridis]GGS45871.1 hypothetical protein GCM10010238_39490 [Streptomyces niveoruber]GGS79834.1 hypothetical protein GCM10010240_11550 [Streptomyces griseoviridis]GGU17211.1 hypothetical protein GCM10010259_04690 [Streptomyces daghestanicus]GHI35450.1 hypothetical protein Sdagh_71800 [Streptomyces daghestanicus]